MVSEPKDVIRVVPVNDQQLVRAGFPMNIDSQRAEPLAQVPRPRPHRAVRVIVRTTFDLDEYTMQAIKVGPGPSPSSGSRTRSRCR